MSRMAICDCRNAAFEVFSSYWSNDEVSPKVIKIVAKYLSMRYGYTTVNQITQELLSILHGFEMDDLSLCRERESKISNQVRNVMHSKKVRKEFYVMGEVKETKQYIWAGDDLGKIEKINRSSFVDFCNIDDCSECNGCEISDDGE